MWKMVSIWLLLCGTMAFPQEGFRIPEGKQKVVLRFKLVNNLILVTGRLNGTPMTFLVDSGVDETVILQGILHTDLLLHDAKEVKLKGLGSQDAVLGIRSEANRLELGALMDSSHPLYVLPASDLQLSTHLGEEVHGIIGRRLFQNHLVEIDYQRKRLTFWMPNSSKRSHFERRFQKQSIDLIKNKPYLKMDLQLRDSLVPSLVLVDTGNSDAVWVFGDAFLEETSHSRWIEDYLGEGFSGTITGKRARIPKVRLLNYVFENPLAAMPDSTSLQHAFIVNDRMGSVGGEILRRFTLVFDYTHQHLYFKANRYVKDPFEFDMSGLGILQDGKELLLDSAYEKQSTNQGFSSTQVVQTTYSWKPIFKIVAVRKNSPAEQAGIETGDVIRKIQGKPANRFTLFELLQLFKKAEGAQIRIQVERQGKQIDAKLTLRRFL